MKHRKNRRHRRRTNALTLRAGLVGLALATLGCNGDTDAPPEDIAKSTRAALQWKRNVALERDLMRALELPREQVCNEFGRDSCTRTVHHIALGGADPLTVGLYEPLDDTLASTPVVFDRVVLSACANRATLDRDGDPIVFTTLDLEAGAPEPGTPEFDDTIVALYRRLLSRDPEPDELDQLAALARDPEGESISAYDFAVLACFTIGTTTEFLFF